MANILKGELAERAFVEWYQATDLERREMAQSGVTRLEKEVTDETRAIAQLEQSWSFFSSGKRKKVSNRQQALRLKQTKLRREKRKLETMLSPETARAVYVRAVATPRVSAIHVMAPMTWIVHTHPLFSFNKEQCRWHMLGKYRVDIDLANPNPNCICWRNTSFGPRGGTHGSTRRYEAPQIMHPGTVQCLGTADEPMTEAYRERAYDTLVSVALRFAECSATSLITLWPVARQDEVPKWYLETALQW